MPYTKQKTVEALQVNMRTKHITVMAVGRLINTNTGQIEAERAREIRIAPNNTAKAKNFGILDIATAIWNH